MSNAPLSAALMAQAQSPAVASAQVAKAHAANPSFRAAREAAESFEAIFISQMLAPMFESLPSDGPFGGGHAEKIFRSMQVEELGKAIAGSGGLGIADSVMREILKAQEV